jgi:hypothetical protein
MKCRVNLEGFRGRGPPPTLRVGGRRRADVQSRAGPSHCFSTVEGGAPAFQAGYPGSIPASLSLSLSRSRSGLLLFRSLRGERLAGLGVVLAIFISAMVALVQTIERFIHPRTLSHVWMLAAAGVIGFVRNEVAAQVRLRAAAVSRAPPWSPTENMRALTVRQPRCSRQRGRCRARIQARRPDHRSRDHARDLAHHLGVLAHGQEPRDRPRAHRRPPPPPR